MKIKQKNTIDMTHENVNIKCEKIFINFILVVLPNFKPFYYATFLISSLYRSSAVLYPNILRG